LRQKGKLAGVVSVPLIFFIEYWAGGKAKKIERYNRPGSTLIKIALVRVSWFVLRILS